MKKSLLVLSLFSVTVFFFSCRETKDEPTTVVEKEVIIKEESEPEVEENKGILERAGEEIDKEVNKEINEEIDKIGDDN